MNQVLRSIGIKPRMVLVVITTVLSIVALVSFSLNQTYKMQIQEKQIKTQHLVESAVAMVEHEYEAFKTGQQTEEQAKQRAIKTIEALRYGDNDYFWINDMQAVVVMHPIKPALNGKDLSKLEDPNGKRLFQSFVDTVKAKGRGNEGYLWPKPGFDQPVEKVSYVAGFKPWGWVIGTGIYIDDVEAAFWETAGSQVTIAVIGLAITVLVLFLIANSIITPMDETNRAMRNISQGEGDLTKRLDASGNDEMSQLARSFNLFVDQIQSVIREVDGSTQRVASAAEQLTQATSQSTEAIHRQTTETDQVATAINEMAATIHQVAQSAISAAETTRNAEKQTHTGKDDIDATTQTIAALSDEVGRATDVIKQLDDQANNIASVLDVIGGIAEQTNLLALNAAIEAARAGEQGRGFAVVADEVRTLASRTQDSTHEIETMIEKLQAGAKQAVSVMEASVASTKTTMERADETQAALEEIARGMLQVNDMISQIASAAEQQSAVAEQISASVVSIVDLSEDSSHSADQTRQASTELSSLAGELKQLIHRFKV
ncbi:methyl-accepting chemotaxis protein [Oceanospirillum sanctuarii]|uniref:methyl-accepting chemotaxis protein n=1 Tax=Oceanospirillum sanctuarii TaxID=1434821 RepID=UPI000A399315|nr:methyl-accepting chemotaxis protein [Oceanospirillum sanctuarii]